MENNGFIQTMAEIKVLEYKLDKIRKHISKRLNEVDPIMKAELASILDLISFYECVPADWKLDQPLVKLPENFNNMEDK